MLLSGHFKIRKDIVQSLISEGALNISQVNDWITEGRLKYTENRNKKLNRKDGKTS